MLEVDANTLALYLFKESSSTSSAVDATGSTAKNLTSVNNPGFLDAVDGARSFDGASQFFKAPVTADVANAFRGATEWTIEALVNVDPACPACGLVCIAPDSTVEAGVEAEATNDLLNFNVLPDRSLRIFWEYGAGTTGAFAVTGAGIFQFGVANLFTIVKRLSGGQYFIDFYVNGNLAYTFNGTGLSQSTGGTSASLELRVGNNNGSDYFKGWVDEVRLSNKARTSSEITASYQKIYPPAPSPSGLHSTASNANLLGLWRFDAADSQNEPDATGNGYNLTVNDPTYVITRAGVIGSERYNAATNGSFLGPCDATMRTVLAGSFTIEGWLKWKGIGGGWSYSTIVEIGDLVPNRWVSVEMGTSGLSCSWSQSGAIATFQSGFILPTGVHTHIAVVKDLTVSGGRLSFYINGDLIKEINGGILASDGPVTGAQMRWMSYANGSFNHLNGALDEWAIHKVARTSAEISQIIGIRYGASGAAHSRSTRNFNNGFN